MEWIGVFVETITYMTHSRQKSEYDNQQHVQILIPDMTEIIIKPGQDMLFNILLCSHLGL